MHVNGPELVAIDPDSDGGLGGTSDDLFGPLVRCFVKLSHVIRPCSGFTTYACAQAVLLVGFAQQEVDAFRALMIDMDADMVKVKICT